LNVQNAPTVPASAPGIVSVYMLGDELANLNAGPNTGTVPAGYGAIVDAFTTTAATITGASGQADETVLSGQGGLTFFTNGGAGTVLAGGGSNLIAPGADAPATGGSWTMRFDGGNNTVFGTVGNYFIEDGSSEAAGSNLI